MILKALYDYYHRSGELAPFGMVYKEIPFLIVIGDDGTFIRIDDRRIDKKKADRFLVVNGSRSGTTPKPYLLWDNVEYVANYTKEHDEIKTECDSAKIRSLEASIAKSQKKHDAFARQCIGLAEKNPDNRVLRAVAEFYRKGELAKLAEDPLWEAIAKKPTVNLSFILQGQTSVAAEELCLRPSADSADEAAATAVCLVTGDRAVPVESTTPTPIYDGQAIGRLVAFQVNSGYDSYGKSKGRNASISKEAESCYTTALNNLLARESRNKFVIANRTFVFWASSKSEAAAGAETAIFQLFGFVGDTSDDPDARIDSVRKTFNDIYSGKTPSATDDRFYFLGLAPNAARIAVVYWNECSLRDFAGRILRHFDDMEIVDTSKYRRPHAGLHQILSAIALKGKVADVQPNLPEAVLKSILQATPYPSALYMACLRRIRAEQSISRSRAAIIKAYLNRLNDNNNQKITIMLNKTETNTGYLCGRLFAAIELAQERANGSSNLRSRYLNAASATPSLVFPTLLNLSSHHVDKLAKPQQVFIEKLKGEIISLLGADGFPTHFDVTDQGRFMVGYYHQRQELFMPKKEDKTEE